MARVAIPPTPLAAGLASTLLVTAAARFEMTLSVHREAEGVLTIEAIADQHELARIITNVLKELRPEQVRGALPLIPRAPGADGRTIANLLSDVGLSRPSLSAKNRVNVYDSLVKLVERKEDELASSMPELRLSAVRGILEIAWGGNRYSVPTIVKSEAFYEIGRFGGLSDRRKGQPNVGRINYKASAPLAALLYELLLTLQTGYEADVANTYMFTTIQLEPGRVTDLQAKLVDRTYTKLLQEVRSIGLGTWCQDYEGLRLASLLKLVETHAQLRRELRVEPPTNVSFNHITIRATGNRFFPLTNISVSASELDTATRALESFVHELQAGDADRIARLLKLLIVASLRIMAGSVSSSTRELWCSIRMLAYSFIEGRRYELLDNVYRSLRLLSDERTGLKSELIRSVAGVAETLKINLDSLLLEQARSREEALWKTLKRLVNLVAA